MNQIGRKQPHIALFINSMRKGGAERVMANLAEYLYSRGWKVTLVTTHFDPPEYELPDAGWDLSTGKMTDTSGERIRRIYSEPAEEELQGNRIANFRTRFATIAHIWQQEKPDIILSFIGMTNIMAILTARREHIPVVVSVRSTRSLEYDSRKLRFLSNLTYPHAAGVVFQTPQTADSFPAAIRRKAKVLPNSVNPAFMRQRFEGVREKTIVSVGRLDDNKNQAMLLRAFAGVHADYPAYQLRLYGDGPAREKLAVLAGQLGLRVYDAAGVIPETKGGRSDAGTHSAAGESRSDAAPAAAGGEGRTGAATGTAAAQQNLPDCDVVFCGAVDNIADRIWKSSVYVLCSNIEGMPNSLIEAMSLGLACISTDCEGGGPAMLIESGLNGYLVPVQDVKALESKLRYVLGHPEEIRRVGINASRVQEDYAPEKINREWEMYLRSKAGPAWNDSGREPQSGAPESAEMK